MIIIVVNHTLFHSLHQISRLLTKHANKALLPFGLYSAQWSVIYTLKTKGTLTQTELSEYLAVEAPPLTRNIQRLVKKGFVRQFSGKDKRIKMIELTEKAHHEYPSWEQTIVQSNQILLEKFSDSSEKQLETLLLEWLETINE